MAGKLGNLQALRGIACLTVVLFHAGVWEKAVTYAPKPFFRVFTYFGYCGVDLFFVISGFILTWINWKHLGNPLQLPTHLFKRAWRVYPVMWLAWGVMVVGFLTIADWTLPQIFAEVPQALLLIRPGTGDMYVLLPHAWTLAYEVMFYAVFGVVFLLPRRFFVPFLCAWFGACLYHTLGHTTATGTITPDYPLRAFVLEFLLGCGVAVLIRHGVFGWSRGAIAAGAVLFVAAAFLEGFRVTGGQTYPAQRVLLFGPPSALWVYGFVAREQATGRTLPRWLQKTGDASYSIYLFHYAVLFAVTFLTLHWGHRTKPHLVWAFLTVVGGTAAGFLAHHLAERPLLALPDWIARKLRATVPVSAPAVQMPAVPARKAA